MRKQLEGYRRIEVLAHNSGRPRPEEKPAAWAAALVFLGTYIPLMGKFLPCLLEDRRSSEDIRG